MEDERIASYQAVLRTQFQSKKKKKNEKDKEIEAS